MLILIIILAAPLLPEQAEDPLSVGADNRRRGYRPSRTQPRAARQQHHSFGDRRPALHHVPFGTGHGHVRFQEKAAGEASSSDFTPSACRSPWASWPGITSWDSPIYSSILLAGLFASQTLIAYPIVSKLGIARDKAVTIAVGGTVITDTLALLLLTVIVGMATGNVDEMLLVAARRLGAPLHRHHRLFLFPLLAHWFFKQCSDNVSQYIFVLVMVFLGAYLAQLAGLEPIIGAFLSGLALNRLIPRTSPLMNRIEFVGNAIFIPFFLIGVGMLIDYRAFFRDWESLEVAADHDRAHHRGEIHRGVAHPEDLPPLARTSGQ